MFGNIGTGVAYEALHVEYLEHAFVTCSDRSINEYWEQ